MVEARRHSNDCSLAVRATQAVIGTETRFDPGNWSETGLEIKGKVFCYVHINLGMHLLYMLSFSLKRAHLVREKDKHLMYMPGTTRHK